MKRSFLKQLLLLTAIFLGLNSVVFAQTSLYSEGADLPNVDPPQFVGTISSPGTYTVSGGLNTSSDGQDRFQITINSGLQLSNVTYNISGASGFDGNWNMGGLYSNSISGNGPGTMDISPGGFSYPVPAGTYEILMGSDFSTGNSYVVTMTVTSTGTSTPGTLAFINGASQGLGVCSGSGATSLNSQLTASDNTSGEALSWTVASGPTHGTLSGFSGSATSIVGNSTPSGLTYTPTGTYSGTDAFSVNVSNGTNTVTTAFTVTVNPLPTPTFTAAPGASTCAGTAVTYTTQSGMSSYVWSIPGTSGSSYTITGGSTSSNSVTLKWAATGNQTVAVNYISPAGCVGASSATTTTSVNAIPTPTFTAAPGASTCAGTTVTYTTQAGMSSYAWSIPGTSGTSYTITSGGTTTNSVTLKWAATGNQTVTVNYTTAAGCTGTSAATNTTSVNAIPTPTFTAAPGASTCAGIAVTYTTQTGMSSYAWSIPGTSGTDYTITGGSTFTNSVTLKWATPGSQTVTVNYNNAAGCTGASAATNTTSVNAVPVPTFTAAPGASTCASTAVTYTTQAGMSSYVWSIPGTAGTSYTITAGGTTTNSVTLKWAATGNQTVTVNYNNAAGCTGASAATNTTSVNALPVPTFTSAAGVSTCASTAVTYTTQAGMSSYAWSIPGTSGTDYTITSGGTTTNSVTLKWSTPGSQTVTVNYNNAAGCTGASAATNTTSVNALPTPTFTAAPGASICASAPVTYTTQAGMSSYVWSVPGVSGTDYTITAGGIGAASSTVTLKWLSVGSKPVSINYNNASGCTALSATNTITSVNALPVPTFTTAPSAGTCSGISVTYTTQAGMSSYAWTVPGVSGTDYSITSGGIGSTSNTVTLNWISIGNKTVSINYNNAAGCAALTPVSNTTFDHSLPNPTFTAAPGANTCILNRSHTYTTQTGQSNYIWTVPGVAGTDYNITAGGIGTTNSTVSIMWLTTGSKTVTVDYTNGFGCTAVAPATTTTSANALPSPVTGNNFICLGLTSAYSSLSTGDTWSSSNTVVASVNATSGIATGNSVGTATISYTTSFGCYVTQPVTVSALPATFTVTGGGDYCFGGTGVDLGLNGSAAGVNYQLYNGTTATGPITSGTGSPLDLGLFTDAGSYSMVAINATSGCTNNMTGSASVVIDPLPSLHTVTGGGDYCSLGAGKHVGLDGSDGGITYQLLNGTTPVGFALPGTGTMLDFGSETGAGTYTVVANNSVTGCTNNMSSSATVIIDPLPTVYTLTGGGDYCASGTGVHVGLDGSDAGISYQLYDNGITSGTTVAGGSAIDFGLETAAGTYTVVARNNITACVSNMASTSEVVIDPLPVVDTVTGGGHYCFSGTGVHVGLNNSSLGISYQLYYNGAISGAPVAGTSTAFDFGAYTAAGAYTVVATNNITSCVQNMSGMAAVSIDPLPAVFTVTGGGSYCFDGSGVHVGLDGSASGISYQLYYAGSAVATAAGTSSSLDFGSFTAAGGYTAIATNTATGCVNNMASSATVSINPLPVVHSVTGGGNYCATGTGVHVGLDASGLGASYQLYNGAATGTPLAGTASALDFGLETVGGTYTVIATDTLTGCINVMGASATVTVLPLPVAYLVTGGGNYCTALAAPLAVGISSSDIGINYQLISDTGAVGVPHVGIGAAFNFGSFLGPDTFTVVAVNALTGCVNNMSGRSVIVVNPQPNVFTLSGGGSYCPGGAGVDVMLSGSDSGTIYQLFTTGTPGTSMTGAGGAVDFGMQTTAGSYSVEATNPVTGCLNGMTGTPIVDITVIPVPVVTLAAYPAIIIAGQKDSLVATVTNGGVTPTYQWVVDGTYIAGAISSKYVNTFGRGDVVTCVVTSSSPCGGNTSSQAITIAYSTVGVNSVATVVSDVQVVPNPSKGTFVIKGTIGTIDEQVAIDITNMAGQVVYTNSVLAAGGSINERIQLSNALANGMYILNLHTAGGNKAFHLVIEQ